MFPDLVPSWIVRQFLANPEAGPQCIGCGVCADNCPAHAITMVDFRAQTDLRLCIHCYCCHELCPENAVELHLPWLARLIAASGR
jgi:ferredoxin